MPHFLSRGTWLRTFSAVADGCSCAFVLQISLQERGVQRYLQHLITRIVLCKDLITHVPSCKDLITCIIPRKDLNTRIISHNDPIVRITLCKDSIALSCIRASVCVCVCVCAYVYMSIEERVKNVSHLFVRVSSQTAKAKKYSLLGRAMHPPLLHCFITYLPPDKRDLTQFQHVSSQTSARGSQFW